MSAPLYSSCGFLGFNKTEATEADFRDAGYDPSALYTSCGFLGFDPTPATLYAIPAAWREACRPLSASATSNGHYDVLRPGVCALQTCAAGTVKVGDRCVAPGTRCTPGTAPLAHATYAYDAAGACRVSACAAGTVMRPAFGASSTGSAKCPTGYGAVDAAAACKAAAAHFGVAYTGTVHEPGLLGGCVVHGKDGGAATVAYNTEASGIDSGGAAQFVLCARDRKDVCVRVGAPCGGKSNYTYDAKGHCVGSCGSVGETCVPSERCCGDGACVPHSVACPLTKSYADRAKGFADSIKALEDEVTSISQQTASIGGNFKSAKL